MENPNFDESIFSSVGSIEIIGGPMYAGKTSLAIGLANQRSFLGEKIIYINHDLDDRKTAGGIEGVFTSHNASNRFLCSMVRTAKVPRLNDVDVKNLDLIIVDEGQLFPDLAETVIYWADILKKDVKVYCVDATFEQVLFENVAKLIPHADKYVKVNGECLFCIKSLRTKGYRGKLPSFPTIFSLLAPGVELDASRDGNIHIGKDDLYIATCRRHKEIFRKMKRCSILEIPPTPDGSSSGTDE